MRISTLASSVLALVLLAACTQEAAPAKAKKSDTTSAPTDDDPVGTDDKAGEHGDTPPAGETTPPVAGTEIQSETWNDGKAVDENVTVAAGATLTIAPGATVTLKSGVSVTIKGTLKADSAATHAKLTGANWGGLVIASGGKLDANGLDLDSAAAAIWTQAGGNATYTNGVIKAATAFKMAPGSTLTVSKSQATVTQSSAIAGTFVASHLTYDKGNAGGLILNDAAGSMTISDSILKGGTSSDYVISNAGKLVKVEYTTITGAHCGLHFDAVDVFTIDHVSIDNVGVGAMLYGSGPTGSSITASNFRANKETDIELSGTNGAIKLDKSFVDKTRVGDLTPTNAATKAVASAQPRP